jgi:hypothetical protein
MPTPTEQTAAWERFKVGGKSGGIATTGVLEGVPLALPALTRAVKLQKKAARGRVRLGGGRAGAGQDSRRKSAKSTTKSPRARSARTTWPMN